MSETKNTSHACECASCNAMLLSSAKTDRIRVEGLDCIDCASKLESHLNSTPGIISSSLNFGTGTLTVKHTLDTGKIISLIEESGYGVTCENERTDVFEIQGLDCADCAQKLEKYIAGMQGVLKASLNFSTAVLTVKHSCRREEISDAISGMGYSFNVLTDGKTKASFLSRNKRAISTIVSGSGFAAGFTAPFLGFPPEISTAFYLIAILVGGFYVARSAIYSFKALTPDMNMLMTIAVLGAIAIGQWEEAAAVVFLFSVGNSLQSYTLDKTRNSIKSLISLSPDDASVIRNGIEKRVPVKAIEPEDIIVIRPGERIPMDGIVTEGASTVNQAPITGESIPVMKSPGSEVFAGTINERGTLEVRVTGRFEDNTLSKIIHMVEEAQNRKAPAQEFVDRFAKYYTPLVICGAIATAALPPLILGQPFDMWFYRALVLLVISCPCALVISTPVSIVAAIGSASRNGVLIKGGSYLEECSKVKALAFDKTGTLTEGKPEVTDMVTFNGVTKEEALRIAASLESRSEHPLAGAIMKAYGDNGLMKVASFESITGMGIKARVDGNEYRIGSYRMFDLLPGDASEKLRELQEDGKIPVILGGPEGIIAVMGIMDKLRPGSSTSIKSLHDAGIDEIVMLTGDSTITAKAISNMAGVDGYHAELLPADKVDMVRRMKDRNGSVAMVGDGVNDAPALAEADVGIAMGATGSDTAIETADIALMSNDLSKLSYVFRLGKRTMKIIKQNVAFSVTIKAAFIVLAIFGMANLWMALFADTGAAILVILNGMRLLRG
ncbi:heavy metal translocating P-type ATPase [Methanocella sp. CWC-04]|uniref:Heavy metal translocating P-type ATPase n=1 Tax=Methanooceanicella nereidis TaxID=2052831 RepID=A0AAP2RBX0_9EURY|nr:heavy metal translocating P-type ATPase [Methanocella sp. CWC-04]MCD1293765.1 heavy metal translocating P-type ATPase [Methanocella sp. CWC-04]